jgi:GNAT superfamily N-acetyltransferase
MRTTDVPRVDDVPVEQRGALVQENLCGLFRELRRLPGAEIEESARLARHHAFPGNPMFKGIWNVRDPAAVGEALDWLAARGAPFAFLWAGPGTTPAGLEAELERLGVASWEVDAPGMAAELGALDWDALERVPDGFRIERVRDDDGLEAFARTFCAAFDIPDWAGRAWVDATRAMGFAEAPWTIYLGVLNGEPVATNILTVGGGVAGVLGVGTLEAARGRGIGAAITLAAFREARELGYRYGVLFSTELGLPVYRRIGFIETGSGITRYLWRATGT